MRCSRSPPMPLPARQHARRRRARSDRPSCPCPPSWAAASASASAWGSAKITQSAREYKQEAQDPVRTSSSLSPSSRVVAPDPASSAVLARSFLGPPSSGRTLPARLTCGSSEMSEMSSSTQVATHLARGSSLGLLCFVLRAHRQFTALAVVFEMHVQFAYFEISGYFAVDCQWMRERKERETNDSPKDK